MNKEEYISRIGIDGNLSADLETLKLLQRNHLSNVPFENLDIHWKRPIVLDIAKFYDKIVGMRRGGFCYELNGLFNELLREIGFETRIVSAQVAKGSGDFGPEYDHAAIIVSIGKTEYIADVGFGAFTAKPLRFVLNEEQHDNVGVFRISQYDDGYYEIAKKKGDDWQSEYIFKPLGRNLSEFTEMCDFQQYSPESHFTKGKVCSLLTENGRKTLTDNSFIITSDGEKMETPVASNEEFDRILMREFNIARPQQ